MHIIHRALSFQVCTGEPVVQLWQDPGRDEMGRLGRLTVELALCNRSARTGSILPELAAEEATVSKRATRRTSIAPAADEAAQASGAARRRRSVAPAQTPAAAAAPAGGAAPTTAVSMRGNRRRSSVSPIPDSITKEVSRDGFATKSPYISNGVWQLCRRKYGPA